MISLKFIKNSEVRDTGCLWSTSNQDLPPRLLQRSPLCHRLSLPTLPTSPWGDDQSNFGANTSADSTGKLPPLGANLHPQKLTGDESGELRELRVAGSGAMLRPSFPTPSFPVQKERVRVKRVVGGTRLTVPRLLGDEMECRWPSLSETSAAGGTEPHRDRVGPSSRG